MIVILWHWILTQPLRNYVFLSRHQQLLRLDFEEDFQNVECHELLAKLDAEVKNFGALVLSDYGKGTLKDVQK